MKIRPVGADRQTDRQTDRRDEAIANVLKND